MIELTGRPWVFLAGRSKTARRVRRYRTKSKVRGRWRPMTMQAPRALWMSGTPADNDPLVLATGKRIRAWRKKLDKVEKLEQVAESGKALNDEQKRILASKEAVATTLSELEKLRKSQIEIVLEGIQPKDAEPDERACSDRESANGDTRSDFATQTPAKEVESMASQSVDMGPPLDAATDDACFHDVIALIHAARLVGPANPSSKFHIDSLLINKPLYNMGDVSAMRFLACLVDGSAQNPETTVHSVQESLCHALRYARRSGEEFMPGCSYSRVHALVTSLLTSPAPAINFIVDNFVPESH